MAAIKTELGLKREQQTVHGAIAEMEAARATMASTRSDRAAAACDTRWGNAYRSLPQIAAAGLPDVIGKLQALRGEMAAFLEPDAILEKTDLDIVDSAITDLQRLMAGEGHLGAIATRIAEIGPQIDSMVPGVSDRAANEIWALQRCVQHAVPRTLSDIAFEVTLLAQLHNCAECEANTSDARRAEGQRIAANILDGLRTLGARVDPVLVEAVAGKLDQRAA